MNAPQTDLFAPKAEESGTCERPKPKLGSPVTDLVSWAATKKASVDPKKKSGPSKSSFDRALRDVDAMMQTGDFSKAKPLTIFALYCKMHEAVYGFATTETTPADRKFTSIQIGVVLKNEFKGDVLALVDFVRWSWNREIEKLQWARMNNRTTRRLSARLQFSAALLGDYRHSQLHGSQR